MASYICWNKRAGGMMLYCLIDHDNVASHLPRLSAVLSTWAGEIAHEFRLPTVGDITVRTYGGWWREELASEARFSATQLYPEHCPALIRTTGHYWRVRFEFADSLLLPRGVRCNVPDIKHTVIGRPAPPLSISKALGGTCGEPNCEITRCRRWIFQRRGCTRNACPQMFSQVWVRTEQKQVDTHLAVDLMQLCCFWHENVHVALISDDVDFLPALVASSVTTRSAESLTHVRMEGRATYLDNFLTKCGLRIVNL